jgi:hypothetical protein
VQKYSYVPAVVKVNAYVSSVSRALDLKTRVLEATVCGMSSRFRQITVVPALTVNRCGAKVKLSISMFAGAATAAAAFPARSGIETTAATLEHMPIRLSVARVCKVSFAFAFGYRFEKRGDGFPKPLDAARLCFA